MRSMGALSGSPAVAQTTTPTSMSTERDGVEVYKNQIEEISTIRKEKSKDEKLSTILDEIKSNINSKDSAKFIELYTKLTSHIESEYGYKIPEQKVEELTEAGIASMVKNMTIFSYKPIKSLVLRRNFINFTVFCCYLIFLHAC